MHAPDNAGISHSVPIHLYMVHSMDGQGKLHENMYNMNKICAIDNDWLQSNCI